MNIIKKIVNLINPPTVIVEQVHQGVVHSKRRLKNPPKSYSIHMPQAILTSAYNQDPDRYDHFQVLVGYDWVDVPKRIYNEVEEDSVVTITLKYPKKGNELLEALKNLGKEEYSLIVH